MVNNKKNKTIFNGKAKEERRSESVPNRVLKCFPNSSLAPISKPISGKAMKNMIAMATGICTMKTGDIKEMKSGDAIWVVVKVQ